jgi:hypothetical protein
MNSSPANAACTTVRSDTRTCSSLPPQEAAGIPVLHYDEDYGRIAAITGQKVHWLAPRGGLG